MKGPTRLFLEAVTSSPALLGVENLYGAGELRKHRQPPSVVWVPIGDGWEAPTGYAGNGTTNNPRPVWERRARFEAHIWAADPGGQAAPWIDHVDAGEALLAQVIQALQGQKFDSYLYTCTTGSWANADGELLRYGVVYVLNLDVYLPSTDPLSTEAIVNEYPITKRDFVLPDGDLEPDL